MFNTSHINISIHQEISDAGATGHFFLPGTPFKNTNPATNPLTINLPDGDHINSTHTCQPDIPWIPEWAKEFHIVPGIAHTTLISIKLFCNAGCNVEYDTN